MSNTPAHLRTGALLRDIVQDIAILDGTNLGPSDASWQDVAGTLATNLSVIAGRLHLMRQGDLPREVPSCDDLVRALEAEGAMPEPERTEANSFLANDWRGMVEHLSNVLADEAERCQDATEFDQIEAVREECAALVQVWKDQDDAEQAEEDYYATR